MVPSGPPGPRDSVKNDQEIPSGAKPTGTRAGRPRLGGHGALARPAPSSPAIARKKVLFVCIGNSCRSQMAEAFGQAYGSDVMEVHSAGLSPAPGIAPLTKVALAEKNLGVGEQFPKGLAFVSGVRFDIVVNMTGAPLDMPPARILEWPVPDPIGQKPEVFRSVATQIEALVMRLILELRSPSR